MAVGNTGVKGKVFLSRRGYRKKEDGRHCHNKEYDDLRRIHLHQHISTNAKVYVGGEGEGRRGSNGEKMYTGTCSEH